MLFGTGQALKKGLILEVSNFIGSLQLSPFFNNYFAESTALTHSKSSGVSTPTAGTTLATST